jgi:hypothetical protein
MGDSYMKNTWIIEKHCVWSMHMFIQKSQYMGNLRDNKEELMQVMWMWSS